MSEDFSLGKYLTSTTYRKSIARKVVSTVGRAALKKLDQVMLVVEPIIEVAGPRIATVTREVAKLAPESSRLGQLMRGDGLFKVNPESEALAFKFVTRQGDLSGPELAGALRTAFRERTEIDQILLSIVGDPANFIVPGSGAVVKGAVGGAIRGGRAAARAGGRVAAEAIPAARRAVEEAAPVLRRALAEEAGFAGIPGRGAGEVPPPKPPPPKNPALPPPEMPAEGADDIIRRFGELIASPEVEKAFAKQKVLRSKEIARRAANVTSRMKELLAQGVESGEAMRLAQAELAGPLPIVSTGIDQMAVIEVKKALVARVAHELIDEPLTMISTKTALANALAGRAIPNIPGVAGGSAFKLLSRIFPPEVVESLGKIDGIVKGRAPTILEGLDLPGSRPFIQGRLSEGALDPTGLVLRTQEGPFGGPLPGDIPIPRDIADPRTPEQLRFAAARLRMLGKDAPPLSPVEFPDIDIARQVGMEGVEPTELTLRTQGGPFGGPVLGDIPTPSEIPDVGLRTYKQRVNDAVLDAQEFGVSISDAPTTPRRPLAIDATIDDVSIEAAHLMPPADKQKLQRIAKDLGLTALDVGNLLRANKASVDLSWLRQQMFTIWGHPTDFAVAFRDSLRALWSPEYARKLERAIQNDPLMELYNKIDGTFIRPLEGKVGRLWEANEETMILMLTRDQEKARPIQRFAEKLPWLRISARAHITGTNVMNWGMFKKHVATLIEIQDQISIGQITGNADIGLLRREITQLFGNPKQVANALSKSRVEKFSVEKEALTFERMLAAMTGRPSLGPLKALSPVMNAGFFSFRLLLGRLITPRFLFDASPIVRRQAWKNAWTGIAGMSGVILAGFKMGLWDVEFDPRSADFMNIKLFGGRVSIDVWGGYKQYMVLYSRLIASLFTPDRATKSFTTGEFNRIDPFTTIVNTLVRNKLAPVLGLVLEAWTGRDFKGSEIDRTDWKRWLKEGGGPLAGLDMYEAFEAEGIIGLIGGASALIGAGVLVTELPRWKELDPYYRIEGTDRKAKRARETFRRKGENEAKLFLKGRIKTLIKHQSRATVQRLMRELKIDPKDVPAYEKVFGSLNLPGDAPPVQQQPYQVPYTPQRRTIPRPTPRPRPTPIPRPTPRPRPTPIPKPAPASRWQEVRPELDAALLQALNKVWFEGGKLDGKERTRLEAVHQRHPLGEPNFNAWLKQVLRQTYQNATVAA